jgi:hypothetical protein
LGTKSKQKRHGGVRACEYGERRESCSAQPYWMPPATMQARKRRTMLVFFFLLSRPLSLAAAFSTSMDSWWPLHATRLSTSLTSFMAAACGEERERERESRRERGRSTGLTEVKTPTRPAGVLRRGASGGLRRVAHRQ